MPEPFPHESETVEFRPVHPRLCLELWPILYKAGFEFVGEEAPVWCWHRPSPVPNWQREGVCMVRVIRNNTELCVYEEELDVPDEMPEWDRLEFVYLMATLPGELVDPFIERMCILSGLLDLPILHEGQPISSDDLQRKFHEFCHILTEEWGGPGSKTISLFLSIHHP